MADTKTIATVIQTIGSLAQSKKVQKLVLGSYSDGSPRSIADMIDGEILSPKDREKYNKPKKKKNKKKHKKKKAKINLDH